MAQTMTSKILRMNAMEQDRLAMLDEAITSRSRAATRMKNTILVRLRTLNNVENRLKALKAERIALLR